MKTIKDIRDAVGTCYNWPNGEQQFNREKIVQALQALDTLDKEYILVPRNSIPDGLGEAVKHYELINEPDPKKGASSALNYKVLKAAKLLHSMNDGE